VSQLSSFPVELVCPVDRGVLRLRNDGQLCCDSGHTFSVVDGVPVLLRDDVDQTIELAAGSITRARGGRATADSRRPELFLESLGVSEEEKRLAIELSKEGSKIDPAASVLIGATNGIAYKHLVGRLREYPIPEIRLGKGEGKLLLDVGCSWGRWSIAACRKGFRVVGIDPSLGAIMAAKRVSHAMGLSIDYVCADARYLPFASTSFDTVFSYSVIQHFSKLDAARTLREVSRVLTHKGEALVQMPNRRGLRSQMHLAKRGYSEGNRFEVRYWSLTELAKLFSETIGPTNISVHCFFGLGLESTDSDLMTPKLKLILRASELLRRFSKGLPALCTLADSVYMRSEKAG
jgi:SAM-dependent methyltransferase/uncharacterized protein YbaR (Trm112 family)